jgi:serine/threonine-protein kinase ATR
VEQAFELLAQISITGEAGHKDTEVDMAVSDFIYKEGLGIMAHFTDIVEHSKDRLPLSEKKRSLKAIEYFIKLSGVKIDSTLPQVRATLQSAFETPALVNEAFSAWVELLNAVDEAKVVHLINNTFCIVAEKWASLNPACQARAQAVLDGLMQTHRTEIIANVANLPDMTEIEQFRLMSKSILTWKQSLGLSVHLQAYAQRCNDDHVIVVRQSLQELKEFLDETQESIHESATGPQPLPEISLLYRSLLDIILRFKEQDNAIVDLSTQCLGILGSVDPNQVDTVRDQRSLLVSSNFDNISEVQDFIAHLLEKVLVDAFRSAPNGRQQTYFAYVMQELLKFGGFRESLTQRARSSPPKLALLRWLKLPESVQNTLTPYLTSKYSLTNPTAVTKVTPFPLSGPAPNHAVWLRKLTFYLLHQGKGHIAQNIFPIISRVVHSHNLSVASFMLPYAIQNVVAGGEDFEVEFIKQELKSILTFDMSDLQDDEVENIQQCSEVCVTHSLRTIY